MFAIHGTTPAKTKRKMDQAVFLLILLSGTFATSSSVPRQYYYVNENKTWQEAQSYCRSNYIDLATVVSMVDVNNTYKSVKAVAPGYGGAAWIGLKRSWAWSTGDSLNPNYMPLAANQPNAGNAEGACMLFNSVGWNDNLCSYALYFYCIDDSPTDGKRFIMVPISMNWTDAQTYCKQHYTDLAVVNSTEDYAAVSGYSGFAWIGLISSQWSDGGFSTFRYWAPGNAESSLVNKCGAMVVANSGKWISTGCNLKMPFICYGGLQPVTRHYYYVAYPRTWLDAQRYCKSRFTDLATIDSINDVNSIMDEVVVGHSGSLWIGLSRGTQAQWGWSQGDEPLSNYSNWDAGRPNGSGQCVVNINNVWHDYNCTEPQYFVCYYEGKGYILVLSNKTWQDAQSYCRRYYTDLATIRSPWEQKQLIELVGRGVFVWIGLFLDTWKWSDQGSLFFRNWALGQPSSTSGDCTAMMTSDSGKWTVQDCNAALPFICYGEGDIKRKSIIRIKMSYSGTEDLNDPSMQTLILNEIGNNLGKSMGNDIKLSWKQTSDGDVFVKKRAKDKC